MPQKAVQFQKNITKSETITMQKPKSTGVLTVSLRF
jgi:hypothetical protein